ncbi:extracellular solute-binding protein [Paenibacillus rhizophilus]|nr:extracellular solute-binding protein [Paenibacillus rhizophilus]
MHDIAKLAGVSHGTVSNVINQKGNVSIEKIRLVEEAARKLGYNTNAQAQKLRKDSVKHVAIILPDLMKEIYHQFYTTLIQLLEERNYDTSLHLSKNVPEKEQECIQKAMSNRPELIVTFSCLHSLQEAYKVNTNVLFMNHPFVVPQPNQAVVTFDYAVFASVFADKLLARGYKSVAYFAESENTPSEQAFFTALQTHLDAKGVIISNFSYDSRLSGSGAIEIANHEPSFDVVITSDTERAVKLMRMHEIIGKELPPIISFSPAEVISTWDIPRFELDYRKLAHQVMDVLDGECMGKSLLLSANGFRNLEFTVPKLSVDKEITLATIVSPTSEIISVLSPLFYKATGIKLKIVALPYEELYGMLSSEQVFPFDLIRMDMVWLSRFEKELCIPLGPRMDELSTALNSFLPEIRNVYCSLPGEQYTLPFDPSIQMLFYRKDLFENTTLRRMYYEMTHEQLTVPSSFSEYNKIAAFFTQSINPNSPTKFGTTMTYGSASVAACDFLPWVKEKEEEVYHVSGDINLHSPVFSVPLKEYLETKKYSDPQISYWWGDSLESFAHGKCAMTIVFINHASRIVNNRFSGVLNRVGTAPTPGETPLLGGGCIGISRQSKNVDLCIEFLNWIYSTETANLITLLGGLSPCASVYKNEEILELYPWLRGIEHHFKMGWRRKHPDSTTDFNENQFERILGMAVRNAALDIMSIPDALSAAQQQYERKFLK